MTFIDISRAIRRALTLALLSILFLGSARADEEAARIVQQAFETARANEAIVRSYVFHERVEERRLNKKGEERRRESKTWDVTLLDSSGYRRLIAIDDLPLLPKREAKEQKKLDKHIAKMQSETPKQREKRQARVAKGREEDEKFLEEITKAFDFRLIGEEEIDGVATHVISAEPKESYRPTSRETKVLPKLRAKMWIARESYHWVKADMETLDNVRWALVFKLRKGARIRFKQRPLNDEVWVTDSWTVRLRFTAALVVRYHAELTGSYSNFRRFRTDATPVYGDTVD